MSAMRTERAGDTGNRLLDRLPRGEIGPILAGARAVGVSRGQPIYERGEPVRSVYFPTTAVFSIVVRMEDGRQIEATTIGNEGLIGMIALGAPDFSPQTAIVQVAGGAYRVETGVFVEAVAAGDVLRRLVRRYAAYRLGQASQTIACNAVHSVEERMARWLLLTHDRAGSDAFSLTHEFLAEMLGIRRQSVTVTAGLLQRAGLITYRRGAVRVHDRPGLERASCECYRASRSLYERLIG